MIPGTEPQIEFLERRLACLRLLARELAECQGAYVAMDLDQIHKHLFIQASLCERLREMERDSAPAAARPARGPYRGPNTGARRECASEAENSFSTAQHLRQLQDENRAAGIEVRRLNAIQRRLVNGTRATLGALARSLQIHWATYSHPAGAQRFDPADGAGS